MSEAIDYGFGLFETIRFQNGKAQDLKRHFDRLKSSADELGIAFKQSQVTFEEDVNTAVSKSEIEVGALRYQLSKNGETGNVHIQIRPSRYTTSMYKTGFRINISGVEKSSSSLLVGHKSSNYLENHLVLRKAKESFYDEALYLNEKKYITEGTYTNLFFVKGNVVYTPSDTCGLLKGTMRAQVIELLGYMNIPCIEGAYTLEDLRHADMVFVTNSLMGIMPVREINRLNTFNIENTLVKSLSDQLMADWIY